ncbi:MAG: carboxyl transferase [Eubacterium sp.]|nr:carboxyl transferase [Eubacterium sp.]
MSNSSKMSAKQRIEALVDANSFVEIGGNVTKRNTDFNMQEQTVPADGVITGYGVIDSELVYVYSQDVTAMNGSIGEMHAGKIARLYDMAMKAGAPVIGLIDCAGVRVQEAVDALAGFGQVYKSKVKASGVIPQISAVLGACGGGSAVSSLLSDFTFMDASNGRLFVNSPNAIDANNIDKCDTSLGEFQAKAGNVDFLCENEAEVLTGIRSLISVLPANFDDYAGMENDDDMNRVISGFDVKNPAASLAEIADNNNFIEVKKNHATDMICGLMTLNGVTVGAVANGADAVFTTAGCKKAEKFVYFCDAFGIPVITFTNVKTYASSKEEEMTIGQAVADLTCAFASAEVAKVNVITGEAFGSAYIAMNSRHIGADLVIALEGAKVGVMDAENAVKIMYDDIKDSSELDEKVKEFDAMQCDANNAAKRGYVDNIVEASELRKQLIYAMQMFGMR